MGALSETDSFLYPAIRNVLDFSHAFSAEMITVAQINCAPCRSATENMWGTFIGDEVGKM